MIRAFFFILSIYLLCAKPCNAEDLIKADAGGRLEANLLDIPLRQLMPFFEENYGIRFSGEDNLFENRISVSFNKLDLEKTLKRIFSKTNAVFEYNKKGIITRVYVLPVSIYQKSSAVANNFITAQDQQAVVTQDQEYPQPESFVQGDQNLDAANLLEVLSDMPPSDGPIGVDLNDDITSFQIEINSPPSGDSFQIVPGTPPSGN